MFWYGKSFTNIISSITFINLAIPFVHLSRLYLLKLYLCYKGEGERRKEQRKKKGEERESEIESLNQKVLYFYSKLNAQNGQGNNTGSESLQSLKQFESL